jgi:hypothetical protein
MVGDGMIEGALVQPAAEVVVRLAQLEHRFDQPGGKVKKILAIIGGAAALSALAIAPAALAASSDGAYPPTPTPVVSPSMNIGNIATTVAGVPTVSGVVITTPSVTKASAAVLAGRSECGDFC